MFRYLLTVMLGLLVSSVTFADVIDGEELVDPTRPIFVNRSSPVEDDAVLDMIRRVVPSSYDVSFVRASSSAPMAVINDQRVTIGDTIGGATVVAIDRNGVTLSINSEERRISLFGTSVKTPVDER